MFEAISINGSFQVVVGVGEVYSCNFFRCLNFLHEEHSDLLSPTILSLLMIFEILQILLIQFLRQGDDKRFPDAQVSRVEELVDFLQFCSLNRYKAENHIASVGEIQHKMQQ